MLFVIPWGRHWIIGTTDTDWNLDKAHPAASRADIDYLLDHVNAMLREPLDHEDVEGVYAGLRPLLRGRSRADLADLPRAHRRHPRAGLVMIAGGKLTTYRVMARDAVDAAAHSLRTTGNLVVRDSITDRVPLLGADDFETRANQRVLLSRRSGLHVARIDHLLGRYGGLVDDLLALWSSAPELAEPLEGAEDYLAAEVVYAVTHEGARHLDDVLTRRTRISIETFDRGVRCRRAGPPADGRRARLGRRPRAPTRSTTTCAGSRPSGRASSSSPTRRPTRPGSAPATSSDAISVQEVAQQPSRNHHSGKSRASAAVSGYVARMGTWIKSVTFDCADAMVLGRFWAAALGTDLDEDSTSEKAYVEAAGWGGPNMWFQQVPEPKAAKNRLHFDLRAPGPIPDEVRRSRDSAPRCCARSRSWSWPTRRATSSASSDRGIGHSSCSKSRLNSKAAHGTTGPLSPRN